MENSNYLSFLKEDDVTINSISFANNLPIFINLEGCGTVKIENIDFKNGVTITGNCKELILTNVTGKICNSCLKCEMLQVAARYSFKTLEIYTSVFEGLKTACIAGLITVRYSNPHAPFVTEVLNVCANSKLEIYSSKVDAKEVTVDHATIAFIQEEQSTQCKIQFDNATIVYGKIADIVANCNFKISKGSITKDEAFFS